MHGTFVTYKWFATQTSGRLNLIKALLTFRNNFFIIFMDTVKGMINIFLKFFTSCLWIYRKRITHIPLQMIIVGSQVSMLINVGTGTYPTYYLVIFPVR